MARRQAVACTNNLITDTEAISYKKKPRTSINLRLHPHSHTATHHTRHQAHFITARELEERGVPRGHFGAYVSLRLLAATAAAAATTNTATAAGVGGY